MAILSLQDQKEEQRAKRRRLLSAAASARIRRGMIRYLQVGAPAVHGWALLPRQCKWRAQ